MTRRTLTRLNTWVAMPMFTMLMLFSYNNCAEVEPDRLKSKLVEAKHTLGQR